MSEHYRLVIPGTLSRIRDACDFVVEAAQQAGLNEKAVHHCQLAVDEACTNIIEHGYKPSGKTGQIEIVCRDEADRFSISILDDSPPFDPFTRTDPDPATPLTDRDQGGWGIYFIKKITDETSYSQEKGRNRLIISKLKTPKNMAQPNASHDVLPARPLRAGYWEIALSGRLDSNTAPDLESALKAHLAAGRVRLIVNMSDVDYISTGGLKVLINTWRRTQSQGGNLVLAGMRPLVAEVFEIVGFDQVFAIYEDVADAVQGVAGEGI